MEKIEEYNDSIKLFDVIVVLLKWKKWVLISVFSVMIITVLITLMMDKWYESKAVILLPEKTGSSLDVLMSTNAGGLASSLLGGGGGGTTRYLAILNSRRLREEFVLHYNLVEKYGVKNTGDALKILEKDLQVEADKKLGTITITFYYFSDPEMTAEMTNHVVAKLDEINRELSTEQAKSTRIFIEEKYLLARKDLLNSEDSLIAFQKKFGVIALPEQTKASIDAAAHLQAQVTSIETEYNVKKKTLGDMHPDLMRLEAEIQELKKSQYKMEFGGIDQNIFIPFKNVPDLGLKYLRLYRDVQINSKIVEYLIPQYEQAKIQEAKDTPTLLVLDKAKSAEYPFKPKKKAIVAFMGILVLFLFCCGAYLIVWNERNRTKPNNTFSHLKKAFN